MDFRTSQILPQKHRFLYFFFALSIDLFLRASKLQINISSVQKRNKEISVCEVRKFKRDFVLFFIYDGIVLALRVDTFSQHEGYGARNHGKVSKSVSAAISTKAKRFNFLAPFARSLRFPARQPYTSPRRADPRHRFAL